jgi:hypothetical protein
MILRLCMIVVIIIVITPFIGQAQDIPYEEVKIGCVNLKAADREIIISTDAGYQDLLKNLSAHPDCISYSLPKIDFSKNILLGLVVMSKGCSDPDYSTRVYKEKDELIFKVEVKENGMCKMLITKKYWITVPREFDERVRFITNEK